MGDILETNFPSKSDDPCDRDVSEVYQQLQSGGETALCIAGFYDSDLISDLELDFSTPQELDTKMNKILNVDNKMSKADVSPLETDINIRLADYVLNNTKQKDDGRLIMPLMWNPAIKHRLTKNFYLAKRLLKINFKKLSSVENGLKQVDDIFREQESLNIIEKIPDLDNFLETHPTASFLAHMPVYRQDSKTTKVRMVFLPTQKEKAKGALEVFSNNQCILSGPNINHKINTAVHLLRFDRYLLVYDIKKAFLNIELPDTDKEKLLFLWVKDINQKDPEIQAYCSNRLPFGLKCSPSILMLALYRILIQDAEKDPDDLKEFKKQMFGLLYMDNGGITGNTEEFMRTAKTQCEDIFKPYKFALQQFAVNLPELQSEFDKEADEPTQTKLKLLGVKWDRHQDVIGPSLVKLNPDAKTRRQLLKSINSVYDILGLYLPILNRAKLFLQKINHRYGKSWDTEISEKDQHEWKLICKYINASGEIFIPRSVGNRSSTYQLVCFTDASRLAYGIVMYLIDIETGHVNFLFGKNHLLNSALKKRTIPELEMKGVMFGVQQIIEAEKELTGPLVVSPIKIDSAVLFNDSLATLQRIQSLLYNFDKLKAPSTFVKNCLTSIKNCCDIRTITFSFVETGQNPADHVTRVRSYSKLIQTNFLTGPHWLADSTFCSRFSVSIPHPLAQTSDYMSDELSQEKLDESGTIQCEEQVNEISEAASLKALEDKKVENSVGAEKNDNLRDGIKQSNISCSLSGPCSDGGLEQNNVVTKPVIPEQKENDLEIKVLAQACGMENNAADSFFDTYSELIGKFSVLRKPISVLRYAHQFINGFIRKMREKNPDLLKSATLHPPDYNFYSKARLSILKIDQKLHFQDLLTYFEEQKKHKVPIKSIPPLVNRLNLIFDSESGLIRVKCKLRSSTNLPVLLAKTSQLASLIIKDTHWHSGHSGVYSTLSILRNKYYFEHFYSKVKKTLSECSDCDRYSKHTIKLNQNVYRDFRCNPANIPYQDIFIDHLGHYYMYIDEDRKCKEKVYILLVTCLWSRSINLKICRKMDTHNFLRALQSHVLDFGIPEICLSDLGSSIVAGTNTIKSYISDFETEKYFTENDIKVTEFDKYPKGNSALGSLVECCVKMVRHYIGKVVGTRCLYSEDFRYLVQEAQHFINKRPIAFKEALRDLPNAEVIEAITPEILVRGYAVNSIKIAPSFENQSENWTPGNLTDFQKSVDDLNHCRDTLRDVYHSEFLQSLIHQATNVPDRCKPKAHRPLCVGDVVLLQDKLLKPLAYPMGIIKEVERNDLGETTAAKVLKGATRETVYRHASSLILLIPCDNENVNKKTDANENDLSGASQPVTVSNSGASRPARKAATTCRQWLAELIKSDSV